MREDTFRQITRLHLRHIKCCINNRSFSDRHASKHIPAHMFVWVCEHSPSNTSKRAQTHCQPIFQPSWKSHWLEHKTNLTNHERASILAKQRHQSSARIYTTHKICAIGPTSGSHRIRSLQYLSAAPAKLQSHSRRHFIEQLC